MSDCLLVEAAGPVTRWKLNRPGRRNAMDVELSDALIAAAAGAAGDPGCRAVVLEGSGPIFCAGTDLTEGGRLDPDVFADNERRYLRLRDAFAGLDVPVVAKIGGGAYGGGLFLACYADLRVVGRDAVLVAPEVAHGWLPPGGCDELADIVGVQQARAIILTALPFDGRRAYEIGFADRLADADDLDATTDKLLRHLVSLPAAGVAGFKRLARRRYAQRGESDDFQVAEFRAALDHDPAQDSLRRFARDDSRR